MSSQNWRRQKFIEILQHFFWQLRHQTANSCNPKHLPPKNSSPQKLTATTILQRGRFSKKPKAPQKTYPQNQESFPPPPPKKNKQLLPLHLPPQKKERVFYSPIEAICLQDIAAQAGNSALISLAWSDHPAGEVGRFMW